GGGERGHRRPREDRPVAVAGFLAVGRFLAVGAVGVPGRAAGGLVGGKLAVGGLTRLGLMPAGAAADPAARGARRVVGDGGGGGCPGGGCGWVGMAWPGSSGWPIGGRPWISCRATSLAVLISMVRSRLPPHSPFSRSAPLVSWAMPPSTVAWALAWPSTCC